jgi:hypothetical protein
MPAATPPFSSADEAAAPRDVDTIVTQLTTVQSQLLDLSRSSADPTELLQLHTEYLAVQSVLSQAAHAQLAADDAVFTQATTALKAQAKLLDGMEDQIKILVKDVALAAKIASAVTQAVTLIAKL